MMASNDSALLALLLLSVIILTAVQPSVGLTKPSGVKLVNNEYTGLVVAIHPDEEENSKIIDIIKDMFTNGSSYLYNATKKRAFFKEVTILIPQTWSDKSTYSSPGNATFNGADLIIAPHNPRFAPDGPNTALPYTKQFAGCGEQSLYIHMTSNFLLSYRHLQARVGDYGRVLVHEWGHYRWGLFNEYSDERIDLQAAEYFYFSEANSIWEPVSCPTGWRLKYLKKVDNTEGEYRECEGDIHVGYENGCFTEAIWEQPRISGSIMQSVIFPEVTNFCDSDADDPSYLHNSEAPTKQNKFCDGRSSWDVMREHPDFNGYTNNPPRDVEDVTPTFHVVRAKKLRIVLVLDTSGSMSILKRSNSDIGGSKIMLITDGKDGKKQLTNSMKYEYIENKVIIDSIVISNSASTELENLAKETGGQFDLQTDNSESTGISDAFAKSYESGGTREYERRLELQSTVASFLVGDTEFRKSVYIDSTLGRATVFDFTYFTTSRVAIDVRLTSPTGETFDQSSDEYYNDVSFRKVVIEINGIAEPGSWEYIIQNLATNEAHDVPISVSSYPSEEGVDPIIVDSYLSSSETDVKNNKPLVVYAEVRQGFYPVINANVPTSQRTMEFTPGTLHNLLGPVSMVSNYKWKTKERNSSETRTWRFSGIKNFYPEVLLAGNVSVYGNDTLALPGGPLPELVGEPAPNFTRGYQESKQCPGTASRWTPDADAIRLVKLRLDGL
ncbi:hypothetical protein BSL78_00682 [Apostichopus japonicus]|uniref:Calcium-activated chloride channel N-terminal domain-containing protein n=1 Tax=Stichopus japonicus TaxID=307972 RepID=A0A2G8LQ68_STIJA|nr:hypothetical protein BSL78_00682 [Apostichopus japonicus]